MNSQAEDRIEGPKSRVEAGVVFYPGTRGTDKIHGGDPTTEQEGWRRVSPFADVSNERREPGVALFPFAPSHDPSRPYRRHMFEINLLSEMNTYVHLVKPIGVPYESEYSFVRKSFA
ncbi:hypothetical protein KM043_016120 [Ampulex compressa]|nr:hypothetical protein KM043_016120 [Ampulex compressa]